MVITDALNKAGSEHAIYFLLTAYLEAVCGCAPHSAIPAHVTAFPLRGRVDVAQRHRTLAALVFSGFAGASCKGYGAVYEAWLVFEAALNRLDVLAGTEPLARERARRSPNTTTGSDVTLHPIPHPVRARAAGA